MLTQTDSAREAPRATAKHGTSEAPILSPPLKALLRFHFLSGLQCFLSGNYCYCGRSLSHLQEAQHRSTILQKQKKNKKKQSLRLLNQLIPPAFSRVQTQTDSVSRALRANVPGEAPILSPPLAARFFGFIPSPAAINVSCQATAAPIEKPNNQVERPHGRLPRSSSSASSSSPALDYQL